MDLKRLADRLDIGSGEGERKGMDDAYERKGVQDPAGGASD